MSPGESVTSVADIDELLGPAAGRFFGSGYRGTDPRLLSLQGCGPDQPHRWEASGRAAVRIGSLWSTKGEARPTPHLSTVDAIVVAQQVCTRFGSLPAGPGPDRGRLTRLRIAAGDTPTEQDFENLPVRAVRQDDPDGGSTELTVTVASMRVNVRTAAGTPARGTDRWDEAPYARRALRLEDVRVGGPGGNAAAVLSSSDLSWPRDGLEDVAGWTLTDCFVAVLQLGQVLLYELDGLSRSSSDTLWMRQTTITVDPPSRPVARPTPVGARLERARVVPRGEETWRCADVTGRIGTVEVRCAVTHRLPGQT